MPFAFPNASFFYRKRRVGKTYGEHREALELSNEEHYDVYQYAKSVGLDFVETLCAPSCLSMLDLFVPDYLKVASRDLTNESSEDLLGSTALCRVVSCPRAVSRAASAIPIVTAVRQQPKPISQQK